MKDQTKFCFRTLGQAVCQTLLLLALAASWLPPAKGQVVIVANKLRAPRAPGKPKGKNKVKPEAEPANTAAPVPPAPTALPSPEALALTFSVIPPPTQQLTAFATRTAPPLPKLLSYEFDVLTLDARGQVSERRVETAAYFVEEIARGVKLEMVEIPSGVSTLGTPEAELEQLKKDYGRELEKSSPDSWLQRLQTETPQRTVKLPTFFMGKYEVTQAQWRAVASLPKVNRELMSDPSRFKGGNRPVEQISWEDAVEFCERLSRATGRKYRLPTEAEWEYACRAGTTSPYGFGETVAAEWTNYNAKYPSATLAKITNRRRTLPGGSLGVANAFGLYDMHGNVWEWCWDSWHPNYQSAPADGTVWEKDGIAYLKVVRGGAWDSAAGECRSGARNKLTSMLRFSNTGFRVVLESSGTSAKQENAASN